MVAIGALLILLALWPALDTWRQRQVRGKLWERLALLAVVAAAAAARAVYLGQSSLEHLEATYLFESVKPETLWGAITSRQAAEQMHQPLYDIILRLWAAPSVDETWIRIPSVIFSLACIPMVWTLVRDERAAGAALWAAGVAASSPLLVWYGRDASPYALLAALSLTAIASARQSLQAPSRRAHVRTALALVLAFYTHFHGGWVAITVGLWLLLYWRTRRRTVIETTAVGLVFTLPWIPALLNKLFVSVGGLNEDQAIMRYSHDLAEATSEAMRLLYGTPWWGVLALSLVGLALLLRARSRLGTLVLVAAAVGLLAELHIVWQLNRSKGIVYVDVRHYIYLAPLLVIPVLAIPRRLGGAALAVALAAQLWGSAGFMTLEKPDVRGAVSYLQKYATGPEHAVAFLPAPWYQAIVEYYLFGICPDLVHARSHEGWWDLETCAMADRGEPGSVYGFPPNLDRVHKSLRRVQLKVLWVLDIRDHRFGLAVPPSEPQEQFLCWRGLDDALIQKKTFGDWVVLWIYDVDKLRAAGAPPTWPKRPPETVTSAESWRRACPQ